MQSVVMLSVTYKPFMLNIFTLNAVMLSVVMLNVVMLSVVAPRLGIKGKMAKVLSFWHHDIQLNGHWTNYTQHNLILAELHST
jgi:hypothetical protein